MQGTEKPEMDLERRARRSQRSGDPTAACDTNAAVMLPQPDPGPPCPLPLLLFELSSCTAA